MRTSGTVTHSYRWCLVLSILVGAATTSPAAWLTIHNDFFQIDQNGDSVHTRSGCLRKFNNTYYWYGSANNFSNQTCYSSTDLLHWTYNGVAIQASGTNRIDVVYNDSTKQYVMVLKYGSGSAGNCDMAIATSSTPNGQFVMQSDNKVFGYQIGDMSVYQDDDGKAYLLYVWDSVPGANSGGISQHALASMSSDYLSLSKRLWLWNAGSREAPMMMKANGLYYYLTSLTLWTQSTATQYYYATSLAGPWTTTLTPLITPGSTNSWDTQCDFIFPFKGDTGTVYMYCGDRWIKPNEMRQGDYAWLPITFSPKDTPVVNYYQDWEVDPVAGTWRVFDIHRDLALHKTATASSIHGADSANNVTDSTTYLNFTNYRWESAAGDTQWIRVDLGSPMSINRVILKWDSCYAKTFQIQVSSDASTWSTVYSTAAVITPRTVTDQTFASATARYVRMYATKRGTANGYALFAFMVLNDSVTTGTMFPPGKSSIPHEALLTCNNNTIHYSVPSSNFVKLDIVDCRGKLVAVLVNGFKNAGDHDTVLPGALGHGMYIIRLTTGAKRVALMHVKL